MGSSLQNAPDGTKPLVLTGDVNTSEEYRINNINHNIRLGLPQVRKWAKRDEGDRTLIIAAGGPSLETEFKELQRLYEEGTKILSVNGSYAWLKKRGIDPSVQVILDSREFNARFIEPKSDTCRYFICSHCHPSVFEAARGLDVWIWHENRHDCLEEFYLGPNNYMGMGGGTTVTLRAFAMAHCMGFTNLEVFGFDSCLDGDLYHPYLQPENDKDEIRTIWCDGREFKMTVWMAQQVKDFLLLIKDHGDLWEYINPHGNGLIKHCLLIGADEQSKLIKELDNE